MERLRWTLPGVLALWAAAIGLALLPIPFVGSLVGLAFGVASWIAIVALVVVLGLVGRNRWVTLSTLVATFVLAAVLLNWSSAAPAAYFQSHRALFEHAASTLEPDDTYQGAELPLHLRTLSASGRVRSDESGYFFPQWFGFPDNAGGYFYAPENSPKGSEMYGAICQDPDDLGDGWWACGMTRP